MQGSSVAAFWVAWFQCLCEWVCWRYKATLLTPHCAVKLYVVVLGNWIFCLCRSFQMTDPVVCLVLPRTFFYCVMCFIKVAHLRRTLEWALLKADLQCIPPHGKALWGDSHAQMNQHGLLPPTETLFYHVNRIPAQQNRKQYSSHFLIYAGGPD